MVILLEFGRGRHFISVQHSLRCILPKLIARFGLLANLSVPAVSCCEISGGIVEETDGSSEFTIMIENGCRVAEGGCSEIQHIDVFVYGGEKAERMEKGWREKGCPQLIEFTGSEETKRVALIANSPFDFRYDALSSYDSMDKVEYRFEDDDNVNPVLTASLTIDARSVKTAVLKPLMSRIILDEVSNNMSNYVRLENPRVFLCNAAAVCEAFREDGFFPSDILDETHPVPLPCDVGLFAQHPGTELYCYPSESEDAYGTSIVLECEINGETCRFTATVSPIGRNETKHVEFCVDTAGRFTSKVS